MRTRSGDRLERRLVAPVLGEEFHHVPSRRRSRRSLRRLDSGRRVLLDSICASNAMVCSFRIRSRLEAAPLPTRFLHVRTLAPRGRRQRGAEGAGEASRGPRGLRKAPTGTRPVRACGARCGSRPRPRRASTSSRTHCGLKRSSCARPLAATFRTTIAARLTSTSSKARAARIVQLERQPDRERCRARRSRSPARRRATRIKYRSRTRAPPMAADQDAMNRVGPSERCGRSVAEKITSSKLPERMSRKYRGRYGKR